MSRTVLNVAYPFAPVGPGAVGGSEQVLSALDTAITARGDQSVVVACEGSKAAGTLYQVPLPAAASLTDSDRVWVHKRFQAAIDRAIGAHPVDVIHMHGLDFASYTLPRGIPVIATLHLPVAWYGADLFNPTARQAYLCCVSQNQRETCPDELGPVTVIENGVNIPNSAPSNEREDFALVLGRICPEKNAHEALEAGTLAGMPVQLAGQVFPYPDHQRYFEEKIQPLLHDHKGHVQHRFLGPVEPAERTRLLGRAKCLLHPTIAPETSSLVAMEALAAGTPVIAYRSGALPDIVTDAVTGFLVDSPASMAEAIGRVHLLSPAVCRAEAERRFNRTRMIEQYLELYEDLTAEFAADRRYA